MKLMDSLRNLAQHVTFKRPATVGHLQRIEQLRAIIDRGEAIKQMVATTGWKDLEAKLDERFESMSRALRTCESWEKAQGLQSSLKELDFVRQTVVHALEAAEAARQELETYALED